MKYEQYFGDSTLGGTDVLSDKCPIPIEVKQGQSYYGGSCRVGQTKTINEFEKVCPECACFMSNLKKEKGKDLNNKRLRHGGQEVLAAYSMDVDEANESNRISVVEIKQVGNATNSNSTTTTNATWANSTTANSTASLSYSLGKTSSAKFEPLPDLKEDDLRSYCFEFQCITGHLHVKVLENVYKCNDKEPISIPGFKGVIHCPPNEVLCHEKFRCKFGCVESYKNIGNIINKN